MWALDPEALDLSSLAHLFDNEAVAKKAYVEIQRRRQVEKAKSSTPPSHQRLF